MMKNGFYIWRGKEQCEAMHPLYLDQVVQVIEGDIWVTGMCDVYEVEAALKFGYFGVCVLEEPQHEIVMVNVKSS